MYLCGMVRILYQNSDEESMTEVEYGFEINKFLAVRSKMWEGGELLVTPKSVNTSFEKCCGLLRILKKWPVLQVLTQDRKTTTICKKWCVMVTSDFLKQSFYIRLFLKRAHWLNSKSEAPLLTLKEINPPINRYFQVAGTLSDLYLHWCSCPLATEAAAADVHNKCYISFVTITWVTCGISCNSKSVSEWFFSFSTTVTYIDFLGGVMKRLGRSKAFFWVWERGGVCQLFQTHRL